MARIELRNSTIYIKDGLSGTAAVDQMGMDPMEDDTTLTIDTVVLNTDDTTLVPVGARFTIAGETDTEAVHTVTARTPSSSSPTTDITFTPALGPGTYADNGALTFEAQRIEIKIGEGDLKYTEADNFNYDLDRGELDTVRKGNDAPMEVSLNFVYEHITTGTDEVIAPMDAIKRRGSASEWVSSATDKCEPYAVDLVVVHAPPCGTANTETTTFPDFRSEKREVGFKDANIAVSGKCNVVEPIVERGA